MAQSQLLVSTVLPGSDVPPGAPRYSLLVARKDEEVQAAQRLRYQVFAEEMGAQLATDTPGVDADELDEFCDHLIVRDDNTGEIVGTYRMLPPEAAERAGRLYSESEFDLRAIEPLRGSLVETGRSCVHREHRTGSVVGLVWAGIARYMLLTGNQWLAGCASIPLADGGALAAGAWDVARAKHYSPDEYRVAPLHPWDVDAAPRTGKTPLPPLLKGYLRLGAWVCGPPALDTDFGVADLFVLLSMERVDQRYLKFFLGDSYDAAGTGGGADRG